MEMDDNQLKRLLQEGVEYEADCILQRVDSDPNMKDVIAPEEIHDKLIKQIREHEEALETKRERLSQEEQELIRLGKIYKKKRGRRKYVVLIAAVVCALAAGTISFGDGKKVFTEVKRMLVGRQQTVVNSGDEERHMDRGMLSEEDAYEEINEKFGFYPIKLLYLPEGIEFVDANIVGELQVAQLHYEGLGQKNIIYRVMTNYRTSSVSMDIEDIFIGEYEKDLVGATVSVKKYEIEESKLPRWMACFVYKDTQYTIILTGIEREEVEKILENLYFS